MSDEMSDDELAEKLSQLMGAVPQSTEKQSVHVFLTKVAESDDTTKVGYLTEDEVGLPKLPIRSFKSIALVSDKIMENSFFQEFFEAESEIVTSTSLSRDAKLLSLAVLQKREIADVTKKRKPNKGWFKPKGKSDDEESSLT